MDTLAPAGQLLAQAAEASAVPVAVLGVVAAIVSGILAPVVQRLVTAQGEDHDRLEIAIDYIVALHEAWGAPAPPPIPPELQPRERRTLSDLRRRRGAAPGGS